MAAEVRRTAFTAGLGAAPEPFTDICACGFRERDHPPLSGRTSTSSTAAPQDLFTTHRFAQAGAREVQGALIAFEPDTRN